MTAKRNLLPPASLAKKQRAAFRTEFREPALDALAAVDEYIQRNPEAGIEITGRPGLFFLKIKLPEHSFIFEIRYRVANNGYRMEYFAWKKFSY